MLASSSARILVEIRRVTRTSFTCQPARSVVVGRTSLYYQTRYMASGVRGDRYEVPIALSTPPSLASGAAPAEGVGVSSEKGVRLVKNMQVDLCLTVGILQKAEVGPTSGPIDGLSHFLLAVGSLPAHLEAPRHALSRVAVGRPGCCDFVGAEAGLPRRAAVFNLDPDHPGCLNV